MHKADKANVLNERSRHKEVARRGHVPPTPPARQGEKTPRLHIASACTEPP